MIITFLKGVWAGTDSRVKMSFVVALVAIIYLTSSSWLDLPSSSELVERARNLYADYGYGVAVLAAFVEGLLVVGWYAPGSVVIVLGAVFSAEGTLDIRWFTLAAIAGFLLAYSTDYVLGRFAWNRLLRKVGAGGRISELSAKLAATPTRKRRLLTGLAFFSPNSGGLWSTVCGTLRVRPSEFFVVCLLGTVVWNVVWASLAYWLGELALSIIESRWLLAFVVISFVVVVVDIPHVAVNSYRMLQVRVFGNKREL